MSTVSLSVRHPLQHSVLAPLPEHLRLHLRPELFARRNANATLLLVLQRSGIVQDIREEVLQRCHVPTIHEDVLEELLLQRGASKDNREKIFALGEPPHVSERKIIRAIAQRGDQPHLNDRQRSIMLMARLYCIFLPEDGVAAQKLRSGTIALLDHSSNAETVADALFVDVKNAKSAVDRKIGDAIRKSRNSALKGQLETIRDYINNPHCANIAPDRWSRSLSACEHLADQ